MGGACDGARVRQSEQSELFNQTFFAKNEKMRRTDGTGRDGRDGADGSARTGRDGTRRYEKFDWTGALDGTGRDGGIGLDEGIGRDGGNS